MLLVINSFVRPLFLSLSLLLATVSLRAQSAHTIDSIIYRDTLVESSLKIEHLPLRAGAGIHGVGTRMMAGTLPSQIDNGCSEFQAGSGVGYNFDLRLENPAWGDLSPWSFLPEISLERRTADLKWQARHAANTDLGFVTEQHTLTPSITSIAVTPFFSYQLWRSLRAFAAPSIKYPLSAKFTTTVRLLEPGSVLTKNLDLAGKLPEMHKIGASVVGGFSVEAPLSSKLRVQPEIRLELPIGSNPSYLSSMSVHAGLGFLYDLTPRYDTVPIYEKRKIAEHRTIEIQPDRSPLTATISALGVSRDGVRSKILTLEVSEIRTRNAYPILNFIFFGENSSNIPARYIQYQSSEDAKRKFKGSQEREGISLLELYDETLNILGDRLNRYPKASVTLIGTTAHPAKEENRIELARARAETIKQYLVKIWHIDPSRIKTEAKLTPDHPSPVQTLAGQEENRRVEIVYDDDRLGDPITVLNTEHNATPPSILLVPSISSDTGILAMRATIRGGGQELATFSGGMNGFNSKRAWTLTEEAMNRLGDSLYLTLEVTDSSNRRVEAVGSIPLKKVHVAVDKPEKIQRFSLILFGFDESKVGRKNERVLNQIAKTLDVQTVNRLSIIGYTDEMGDPVHNDDLSQMRAEEAGKELQKLLPAQIDAAKILIEGRGARDQLYDNALPEGRFFSRTVNVTIDRIVK